MDMILKHHLYKDCNMSIALFKNIVNVNELRQSVMNGDFEATLLKPNMVVDAFQVVAAANRAVHLNKIGKMTTKNVHSEVLFCLSPTKNISDCFRKFGVGVGDTSMLVVIVNDDGSTMELIKGKIQGTQISLDEVKQFTDLKTIQKVYKITETELSTSTLTDALVSRIASKEFVTV